MGLFFKLFNSLQVALYRLSAGRLGGAMRGFKVLILTTTGRKSGKPHDNPLGYFERDGGYMLVASNMGKDNHPAWYLNLKANPDVTIQVKDRVMQMRAQIVDSEQRPALWKWMVKQAPVYGGYETATKREIPLVMLYSTK
jgi:deazaflavin-dependent oxidoreductase (nitroreductase family)